MRTRILVTAAIVGPLSACGPRGDAVVLGRARDARAVNAVRALAPITHSVPDTVDLRRTGHVRLIVRLPTQYGLGSGAPHGFAVQAASLARSTWERLAGVLESSVRDTVWLVLRQERVSLNPFAGRRRQMLAQPYLPGVLGWRARLASE